MKQKTSWDRKCQLNGNTLCSKSSRADLTKWSQAIWPCTHICSWKPKVKPLIPLFLLSFLSLNLTFYLWCIGPKKTISEMPFQRRQIAFISGPRDISILKADILPSQSDYSTMKGLALKAGRWIEGDCFEVRWALVLLSGYPVINSQPVSQAKSGYQALCCSVA